MATRNILLCTLSLLSSANALPEPPSPTVLTRDAPIRAASPATTTAVVGGGINGALGNNLIEAADQVVSGITKDGDEVSQAFSAFAAVITAQTATSVAPSEPSEAISIISNVLQPSGISEGVSDALRLLKSVIGPNGPIASANKGKQGLPSAPSTDSNQPLNQPGGVSIFDVAVQFLADGLVSNSTANTYLKEQSQGTVSSFTNVNFRGPPSQIYPPAGAEDAPYDVSEEDLRKAIHVPSTFTYGRKPPLILVPGTGSDGGDNFAGNLIPLLQDVDWADPVWLNIPGYMLDDIQTNAEYVAYAIHYIKQISNVPSIAVSTWSQGGLATQWALKYWPSTREIVHDLVAVSPDYAGTTMVYFVNPGFPFVPSVPSFLQQAANSAFVAALRSGDGTTAYVPTTNIYSSFFDEIVEPQTGTSASGYLPGASNNEVQTLCPGLPAGGFYTHEGVLYNPLTFALLRDALTHDGPGEAGRIGLQDLCGLAVTEGLNVNDVLSTEATIPQAAVNFLLYFPKLIQEPGLRSYAR